jgi:cell division protein FtsL
VTNALDAGPGVREPRTGRSAAWMSVLLVVALAITLAGVFPFRQMISQRRQVETAQQQLASLEEENARLVDEAAALGTPAEIERIAREELGLVRPGETGFAVQPSEVPEEPAEVAPATGHLDERTIVEKIWDFLTGRDLAPDE